MLKHFSNNSFELSLKANLKENNSIILDQISESELSVVISLLSKNLNKDILIIASDKNRDVLFENLKYLNQNLFEFLSWETFPNEDIAPSADIIGKRFETMYNLLEEKKNKLLICNLHSLLQKVITQDVLKSFTLNFKKKDLFDFDTLEVILTNMGYKKTALVTDKREFALRGNILDIFAVNALNPYRIEFFDIEIESIRTFDPSNQRSIDFIENVQIFPADELHLIKNEKLTSITSYLNDFVIIFEDILLIEDNLVKLDKFHIQQSKFFISFEEFFKNIENNKKVYFSQNDLNELSHVENLKNKKIQFEIFNKKINSYHLEHNFVSFSEFLKKEKIENILDEILNLSSNSLEIIFLYKQESEKNHILELLKNKKIELKVKFENGFLNSGFIDIDLKKCFISYFDITKRHVIRRQKWRDTHHSLALEFNSLEIGNYVVHYHSGIGKYLGVENLTNHLGLKSEFFVIEYKNQSKLYVPLSQAHLISKYIGSEEISPNIDELGSKKWQTTKLQAQKQIIGYAQDLLKMQAEREIEGGFEFPSDSDEMQIFEMDFPYVETTDQLNAIKDVKNDMQSKKAADRLIVGDVGYGKTEVAMRAAFKAVCDGKKQVAVLVPTTVLAMQHFDTFKERMNTFPVIIEHVSRFNTQKKNKEILERVEEKKVDILIGTHRILSKDVKFNDLGLIIIDEEQRFGVRAKEHLKKIKTGVDCITLSATPIPRTLYMSMIKAKDMSVINTPPQDRLPIKTILAENEDETIKNAILREISRNGQVFFIHNRVESIFNRAEHIKKILPKEVKIKIAHGQMPSDSIDDIFHEFKNGEVDILFATTIIENGIDIPNANTIIIDRADTFGLSALYQLRGRVGRWNRSSYAYFITPKRKEVSEVARKRLNALLESPSFGGSMKVALRDLEIRGAGDIIGTKQSGYVSNIGFHLYCKLLKQTIENLKHNRRPSFFESKIEASFPSFIPDSYIKESSIRMEIYYRLGEMKNENDILEIYNEMEDRFGKIPNEVNFLFAMTRLKIFADRHHFISIKFLEFSISAERAFGKDKIKKVLPLIKHSDPNIFIDQTILFLKNNFNI